MREERNARRQAVVASHEEIFLAIQDQDVAAAKTSMEAHLQEMVDYQVRHMARTAGATPAKELSEDELAYSGGL